MNKCRPTRCIVEVVYPNNSKEENARRLQHVEDVLNRILSKMGIAPQRLIDMNKYSEEGVLIRTP